MNILLNWSANDCSSSLNQKVEYKKKNDSTWTLFSSVPCGVSSIYIYGLDDDTLYEFRIGSVCLNGLDSSIIYSGYTVQIKMNCIPFDSVTPNETSVDFSFTPIGDYDSFDIVLLDEFDVELDRITEPTALLISGSFTGLAGDTLYKLKIEPTALLEKFRKEDCTTIEFETSLIDCEDAVFDIIVVNDESGSIGLANYVNYIRPGILQIARRVSALILTDQIHFGVIGFSNTVNNRVVLSGDYPYIYNATLSMPFANSTTNSPTGLDRALTWLSTLARDVPTKVIFITDGYPNVCLTGTVGCTGTIAIEQMNNKAAAIKAVIKGGKPVEIITIGVAGADPYNLPNVIASSPDKHYYAASFSDFLDIADTVALSICGNLPDPVEDACEEPTDVIGTIIVTPTLSCNKPNTVTATILSLPVICNAPKNVNANIVSSCNSPTSVAANIL